MAYSHAEIKKFAGLYIQQNSFNEPDGALEICDNCIVSQDGVITKRRGFFQIGIGGMSTLNNFILYQNVLMILYDDKITSMDPTTYAQTTLILDTGVVVSETAGRVGRNVQANSNLYFTSDNGILKLTAFGSDVFTAGMPPALDLQVRELAANGPIGDGSTTGTVGDTQVQWRVTFGRTDDNGNLIEGAPSDIAVITVAPVTDQPAAESASVVTVNTTSPHNLSSGMSVLISSAADSSGNPAGSTSNINGTHTVTVTGPLQFTFSSNNNFNALATLTFTASRLVELEFSVPSEIQSANIFYRVYRSSQTSAATVSPPLDFKMIKQTFLTGQDVIAGAVFFQDSILDLFQSSAAELYTNPNSQEGELQANTRPPLCDDVCFFKNYTFYANCTSRHSLTIALVSSSSSFINEFSYIEVKLGATTRRYIARTGVGNSTVTAQATGTTNITVTYTGHQMQPGDTVYVSNAGTIPNGFYPIFSVGANTFQFTAPLGATTVYLDFEGATDASGNYMFQLVPPGSSPAAGLDLTARGIVRAINRDTASLVYARYLSAPTQIPGEFRLEAKGFGAAFSLRGDSISTGGAFSPVLPDSFLSGVQVSSVNNPQPNQVFVSKIGEPESVPIVNNLPIGSKNKNIQRIFALRDCVIVIKEDGVFRIDGDNIVNFTATIIDSTVICLVPSSAALINNTVMMLSNQGVVSITNSAVQVVSYKIELVFRAILGSQNLLANTSAVAYESERLYMIATLAPNTTSTSTVYCYNVLAETWTTWDTVFVNGIVGPADTLFLITTANNITKERKLQTKIDYCGQDYPGSVVSVNANGLSAVVSYVGVSPEANDILIFNQVISRLQTVLPLGGNQYAVTFYFVTNLMAGDTPTLYAQYASTLKFAPFDGGAVNRSKQFAQFQVHCRDAGLSVLQIFFGTDTFGSSEIINWTSQTISSQDGWGMSPWGFFPWGLPDTIDLQYISTPAPIIRTYVPRFAQRSTFIQPQLIHSTAGERMDIQEIGFEVRGYSERVSR